MSALPGPGIERQHASVGADPRHVGDAADIEEGGRQLGHLRRQRAVVDGHQRRPLPAGRDVGGAQVEHHVDAGALGQQAAVAELHRQLARRVVQHRLPVIADEIDLPLVDAVGAQEAIDRIGVELGQLALDVAEAAGARAALAQLLGLIQGRAQLHLDLGRIGIARRRPVPQLAVAVRIEQRHVDAVHRGPAHQPKRALQLAHYDHPVHVPAAAAANRLTVIAKL